MTDSTEKALRMAGQMAENAYAAGRIKNEAAEALATDWSKGNDPLASAARHAEASIKFDESRAEAQRHEEAAQEFLDIIHGDYPA